MQTTVTTTITTSLDINTFEKQVNVEIVHADGVLPRNVILPVVEGSLKMALMEIDREKYGALFSGAEVR